MLRNNEVDDSAQARDMNNKQCHEQDTRIASNDWPDTTNLISDASESSSAVRNSSTSSTSGQSSRVRSSSSSASDAQFVALAHDGQGSISEYQSAYEDEHQHDVHNAPPNEIEVDSDNDDSALGDDTQSITRSLDSSIYNYREEYGRTYHGYKDGKYYLPNDEPELNRLDLMHATFRMTYEGKLFFAPVTNLRNALDVGTGTGIWAIDLADEYPECQVVGTDLSPGQPTLVPPNLRFIIDDAEDIWLFPNRFDLIHARLMVGGFNDWPKFFREAYRNLEPGGWLELQEFVMPVESRDGTHKNTNILKWGQLLCEAARRLGRPMGADVCDLIAQQIQDAGFVDVQQRNFAWPTNTWPKNKLVKELGLRTRISCTDGMEGLCLALLMRGLGWSKEEVDVFVALVKKDFNDRSIHAYIPMPVFFGRKPEQGAG